MDEPRRFYVYALIDPRNGKEFYIGKGSGKRYLAHEAEARNRVGCNAKKVKIIREIESLGLRVQYKFIEKNITEAEAFAQERQQIAIRKPDLSNAVSGRSTEFDKMSAFFEISKTKARKYAEAYVNGRFDGLMNWEALEFLAHYKVTLLRYLYWGIFDDSFKIDDLKKN